MYYLELCTNDQLQSMYAEFDATAEDIEKNVEYLINWLTEQPHLPNITDKIWLENILLRCKNQLNRAEKFLDQYYTCRAEMTEIFSNRDPCAKELQDCLKVVTSIPTPKLTHDGYRIMCYRIFEHEAEDIPNADVLLRSYQIQMDIILKEDRHKGLIVIANLENISYRFFTLLLSMLRQSLIMATKVNRIRLHKVYVLNMTSVLQILLTLTKSILKKELADRIEVWNKAPSELIEILPKASLPQEYGGDDKCLDELRENWCDYLKTFKDWLLAEANIKADLDKKPKTSFFKKIF